MDVGHWSFGGTLAKLRDDINTLIWLWEEERLAKSQNNITVNTVEEGGVARYYPPSP